MSAAVQPDYVNLTTHLITLYTPDGKRWKYSPDDRGPARIDVEYIHVPDDEWGFPSVIQRPSPEAALIMNDLLADVGVGPYRHALVSNLCLYYVSPSFIHYVAAPDTSYAQAVRDESGHLKGVRRLIRMEASYVKQPIL